MRIKQLFLTLVLLCAVVQGAWAQNYDVWDGVTTTKPEYTDIVDGGYFEIRTAAELAYICQHFNESSGYHNKSYSEQDYILEADLDMGDEDWIPLGWYYQRDYFEIIAEVFGAAEPKEFKGRLWGNKHKIRINITKSTYDVNYQGLFAVIGEKAYVESLTVEGRIAPKNSRYVGGIAGQNKGSIFDCVVKADVSSGWSNFVLTECRIGGIVGENSGKIDYCCMTGNVENDNYAVGGLVGYNVENAKIDNCTFYGKRISDSEQANIYVGRQEGTATNLHSSDLLDDAAFEDYFKHLTNYLSYTDAIKSPYAIQVKNVGTGTVECSVKETRPGQTVTLTKTSGNAVASLSVRDSDGTPVAVNGNETAGWTFTMPSRDVSVTVAFYNEDGTAPDTGEPSATVWDGSSQVLPNNMETSTKTIHISTAAHLEYIRSHWLNVAMTTDKGYRYYECNYILDSDLDMTAKTWTPFGSTKYSGTFNGNGHTIRIKIEGDCDNYQGLFADINEGGKVENLHVAGNIHCNNSRLVGGIAGCNRGTISNCWVSADVRSDWDGIATLSAYVGGICGENYYGTVEYCCMTGNVTNKRHYVAGIAGSNSYGTIKNCTFYGSLFNDPDYNTNGNKYVGWKYSEENCFDAFNQSQYDAAAGKDLFRHALMYPYTLTVNTEGLGTVQTVIADKSGATETYPDNKVTLEVTSGTAVSVTVTDADGNNVTYDSSDENHYWFNMPRRNATATVVFYDEAWAASGQGTEADPYLISNAEEWDRFAYNVGIGQSFSGMFIKLTADISVTSMAGINKGSSDTPEVYPFSGTLDGDGHTLTCHYNSLEKWTGAIIAPFRYVSNATIKNLKTAGAITTDAMCAAGIVGDVTGTLNLTNCCSSVNISSTRPDIDAHGGLVASNRGNVTISGCAFDGTFVFLPPEGYTQHTNQYGTTFCGGIVGMCIENTTTTITNSLVAPSSVAEGMVSKTFVGLYDGATVTVDNCYFVKTANLPTNQGSQCIFTNDVPNTLGTLVQDYGMVRAYDNGIFYDGLYYIAPTTLAGSGTEDDPYLINNTYEWNSFVYYVKEGNTYFGEYVKLTADISVTQKCGTVSGEEPVNGFYGSFDGGGHTITATITDTDNQGTALFSYICGATIENLTVAGTITGDEYAAAIVGLVRGEYNIIENCVATANVSGGFHIGGILGNGKADSSSNNILISSCEFSGKMTGGDTAKGAFFGWIDEKGMKILRNCLYLMADGQDTEGLDLVRQEASTVTDNVTVENCYYVAADELPTSLAERVYATCPENEICKQITVRGVTLYSAVCTVSGVEASYDLMKGDVSITPVVTDAYGATLTLGSDYTATLNGQDIASLPYSITTIGDKTLTITGKGYYAGTKSIEIYVAGLDGKGDADEPYIIDSTDRWNDFASYVKDGIDFSGKYVRLDADIEVSQKVGTMEGNKQVNAFSGTFLGNNKTITATIADNDNQGTAPFCYINGATIRDLTVAGTITSSQRHIAGLVGFANGTNLIEDCAVTATLNANTDYAGGIVGHGMSSTTTIRGCVFAGTIVSGSNPNVGVIWGWSNSGKPTLEDCLEVGTYTSTNRLHPMGLQGNTGTITGCYYVTPQIGEPQNACTVSGAKRASASASIPDNLGNEVQKYDMLTAYGNGILYADTYYVVLTAISLADNDDNSTTISDNNGAFAEVTLDGRTFYRDGAWNTLCLPFSVADFNGTPLEGATVKTLTSTDFSAGTLTMNFGEDESTIEAGKPYIVKWEANPVNLSKLTGDYTVANGDMLTGTLYGNYKISIAAGATVTLKDATINGTDNISYQWAGINCLGDATIILKGTNTVRGFFHYQPGIHVPSGSTLTIVGSGSLNVSSNGGAAGIGGGMMDNCGNIVIEGGTINATGGRRSAAIGGGYYSSCGTITITDGVTEVSATKGEMAPNSIGAGLDGNCGTVTVGGTEGAITDDKPYTGKGTGGTIPVVKPADIVNPVFTGITISNATANVETGYVDFVGTYSPVSIYTAGKTNLYLGAENTLYYPTESNFQVNAFRGYFQLKQGLTAGESTSPVRAFVLNFGDDERNDNNASGIITTNFTNSTNSDNEWYSLDGCRLSGKPTAKGIYINNGRKVAIK